MNIAEGHFAGRRLRHRRGLVDPDGVCMLSMGMMMFGMMSSSRGTSGRWPGWWPGRWPGWRNETPVDVLERRFTEGEISLEGYRDRREALTTGARRERGAAASPERHTAPEATREEEP